MKTLKRCGLLMLVAVIVYGSVDRWKVNRIDASAENVGRQVGKRAKPFAKGFIDGWKSKSVPER